MIRLPRQAITPYEDIDQTVLPICLAWKSSIKVPREKVTVVGWGRTNNDPFDSGDITTSGVFSSQMMKLELDLVPVRRCKNRFEIYRNISRTRHICAGRERGIIACSM